MLYTTLTKAYGREVFQILVDFFRKRKNVVGVWSEIRPGVEVSVTAELDNGKGRQVKINEKGKIDSTSHGKVVRRRVNRGHPNADTLFIANDGKETMLESREF